MGVELLNNFANGLYCGPASTAYEFQTRSNVGLFAENDSGIVDRGNNVKHSLKNKVIERLKIRGLDNITADFSPRPSYPMTEEEKEKDKRRKHSNRMAAQRSREKQKREDEMNKKLLKELKEEQQQLMHKLNEKEEEKNELLFKMKQILPEYYIQEALEKIIHTASTKKDPASRMETRHSNENESSRSKIQQGVTYTNDTLDQNENIFTENSIFEETCPEDELFISSIHNVSEGEIHFEGIVDFLEVGNEETVQMFDTNFISVENTEFQSIIFQDEHVFESV